MFKSYYRIKIIGGNPNSFLSKLIAWGYQLLEVDIQKDALIVLVNEEDYLKLLDLKTIYKFQVLARFGKAKYQYLIHKYFLFLLALLLACFLLKFLSSLILKVEVIHTKQEIRQLVLEDLESYGIQPYRFKTSFAKKEKIADEILEKERDHLEWIEIEEVGTTYRVNVEERKKNTMKKKTEEQSIIAKKQGRILEIEASRGEIVKKKNDYVQKGDVLISGIIKNKDTPVKKVRAEGKVFAEVWYQVQVEVPYHYREEQKTGKKKRRLEIRFLNHNYTFFDFKPYKESKKKRIELLKNNLLPIAFCYTTIEEVKVKEEIHNAKEAYQKALLLAEEKLKTKLKKEDTIISQKTLKKSHKNSKIVVEVFFKVKENIADTQILKSIDLEKLKQESEKEGE